MLHLPCGGKEWFLFGLFWLGGVWTIIYECCIVVWHYHKNYNSLVIFHFLTVALLACLIYSNMYYLISTDILAKRSSGGQANSLQPGWKYCEQCMFHVPPRSHHCKLCSVCILKRDHHCWFAGYCVGFGNHRYFVSLAFYMSIAGIYANVYNWQFVMNEKGGFAWTTIPSLVAPHVGLMLGYYSWYEFALTMNTSIGFFFTIFFLFMLCTQVIQIVSGQVMHERKKQIHVYNLGWRHNVLEVFGSRGLMSLLCPFVHTQLVGDGTSFLGHLVKNQ